MTLHEILAEPKRKIVNLDAIGLAPDGGVQNILAVYNLATPAEKDYWGRWYHYAQHDTQELAEEFNLPFERVAAMMAVLSPGSTWFINVLSCRRVLENAPSIPGYPANVKKARDILATGDVRLVSGPKVSVFFRSLLDPAAVEREMVLDGHAVNIWRGRKIDLKSVENIGARQALRQQMVADYHEAAKQAGVPVQAIQACTWYIWKYGKHQG